jgi:WD40 repeat protein
LVDTSLHILKSVQAHEGRANSSFFSLDDKFIITGGQDEVLNVWNSDDLSLDRKYDFGYNSYTSVHGFYTLGGCGRNGVVAIYDKRTTDTLFVELEPDGANHLFYVNPDTTLVISSGLHGYELDIQSGVVTKRFAGHTDRVYCIMPSNDKSRVVTSSADSTVKIFNRATENLLYTSPKLDGRAYVSCFSHDDDLVAASTSAGSIYFLDTTLTKVKMRIDAFDTRINTIHYSPSGDRMVAGSEGGGAKIFDTRTGDLLFSLSF